MGWGSGSATFFSGAGFMADRRAIMRIQLDANAKNELDQLCEKRGMTQIAMMSRLVGWFVKQDEVIQTAVMTSLSDAALSRLAKQMLKQMASRGKD
jgi:predicted transcriptional regulator